MAGDALAPPEVWPICSLRKKSHGRPLSTLVSAQRGGCMAKPEPEKPNEDWKKPAYKQGGERRAEDGKFGNKQPPKPQPERPPRDTK